MKKIIALLLSVLTVFSLSACSISGILSVDKSLKAIEIVDYERAYVVDFDADDRYVAMLYIPIAENEEEDFPTTLALYDIKKEKYINRLEIDDYAYCVVLAEDGIRVWTEEHSYGVYDYKLNYISDGEGLVYDGYAVAEGIDEIDAERYVCQESVAVNSNYIYYDTMIFYDNPQDYYFIKHTDTSYMLSSFGEVVLDNAQRDENGGAVLTVTDYNAKTIINTLSIDDVGSNISVGQGLINEYCVCFDTFNDYGDATVYYWNYNQNQINEPIDCIVINDSAFQSTVDETAARIYDTYGVKVMVNTPLEQDVNSYVDDFLIDSDEKDYSTLDTQTNAQYLLCLYDLEYCLSTFPKELYTEVLCKDMEDADLKFDIFNIYLVGEVKDPDIDAFAYYCDDELDIVYGCSVFGYSTFCHELMHILERRILNNNPEFDNEWSEYNPFDFSYSEDYLTNYLENEAWQEYFAREYGMSNFLEDRATVFELVCDTAQNNEGAYWLENEKLVRKAEFLCESLEKYFPSLAAENPWSSLFE